MIKRKTVFILGAGASKPYGFPTGIELKNGILETSFTRVREVANLPHHDANYSPIWRYIFDKCGEEKIHNFLSSLSMSGRNSVDSFLEHRPEFIDIGKLLIARHLIQFENQDSLYSNDGNWYQYIYEKLNASLDDFPNNNLSIITFNYDRSLEYYLLTCLQHDYGVTEETATITLSSINIIHLHGKLGELPAFSRTNSRNYEAKVTEESLAISAANIKIIYEDVIDDQQFKKAKELISEAERIWFLGFGFGKINLGRLELPGILKQSQQVYATTLGLKYGEIMTIRGLLNGYLQEKTTDMEGILGSLDYLRKYAQFLT